MDAGRSRNRTALVVLALAAAVSGPGCVKRRYTIRTDPPGAVAYVNGEEIGTTPVSRSFTYYGARDITLVADGYRTEKVLQEVKAPWWDSGFTDFFTENLLPVTLRDEREFEYKMVPSANPPTNDVLVRAQALRQEAQAPAPPKRRNLLQWLGLMRASDAPPRPPGVFGQIRQRRLGYWFDPGPPLPPAARQPIAGPAPAPIPTPIPGTRP